MRRLLSILVLILLPCTVAFAQSSGNFAAEINMTTCTIDNSTGALVGGISLLNGDFPWETQIKVPNGSGTSLLIQPSFVTGIFTRTKNLDGTTATATAGIRVCVDLDEGKINGSTAPVCVTYDKRFQQVSAQFMGEAGADCDPITPGVQPCFVELILSTLNAHMFNFVGHDIPGGVRTVTVDVEAFDVSASNATTEAAYCVGPGVVAVTQTKVYSTSDGIDLTP